MKPLTPAIPHAIIMMGIPGSGKSTFAERFAETFQAPIVNVTGVMREADLAADQAAVVGAALLKEVLKSKRTFIYEGETHSFDLRTAFVKDLTKKGFKPLIVWVQTDTTESRRRAVKPYPKGSGLTDDEFDQIIDQFEPPEGKEKYVVVSGKHTFATQLKIVLKQLALAQPRPHISAPQPRGDVVPIQTRDTPGRR